MNSIRPILKRSFLAAGLLVAAVISLAALSRAVAQPKDWRLDPNMIDVPRWSAEGIRTIPEFQEHPVVDFQELGPLPEDKAAPEKLPVEKESKPPKADETIPPGLIRLTKDYDLWMDPKRKLVVVDGRVALREGQLEMFACPKGTKEHESIVAVNCRASFIHAALLAVGAEPGKPVTFVPRYEPARGEEVAVYVLWRTASGEKRQARAQAWMRIHKSNRPFNYPWVFAGSYFTTDENGERHFQADFGDLICVSNFRTAMLDLPVESSDVGESLLFEANTEVIPPLGTPVRLVLIPRIDARPKPVGPDGKVLLPIDRYPSPALRRGEPVSP